MKKTELTFQDYISNEEIKIGDVFHGVYEVASAPKITASGYEWKVRHRRWNVNLRMLRPDPSAFIKMGDSDRQSFVSAYQRIFIPMQLHPRIEAFYDVRHIGGSTALFTEWSDNGTLSECMENGSLYRGDRVEVEARLLRIAGQIARALQFLESEGVGFGAAIPENVMIDSSWNAKLSAANLLVSNLFDGTAEDNKTLWALTVLEMYLGHKIDGGIEAAGEDYHSFEKEMVVPLPESLGISVIAAMNKKLPSLAHVFLYLKQPLNRDYPVNRDGYRNNFALRLSDCGKWDQAREVLSDLGDFAPAGENLRIINETEKSGGSLLLQLFTDDRFDDEV